MKGQHCWLCANGIRAPAKAGRPSRRGYGSRRRRSQLERKSPSRNLGQPEPPEMTVCVKCGCAAVPFNHQVPIDDMPAHDAQPRRLALVAFLLSRIVIGWSGPVRGCVEAFARFHAKYALHGGCHVRFFERGVGLSTA